MTARQRPTGPERPASLAELMLDHSIEFIGVLDPSGVVLEANHTALAFAGVARDDVIGRPFWETPWWSHSAEQQARLRQAIARAASGIPDRFESTHPTVGGELEVVDFSLTPYRDDTGVLKYLIPEGRVITSLRRAAEGVARERQRLESIIAGTNLGTWDWNVQSGETVFNERWAEIIGYTLADLQPISIETWRRFAHPEDLARSQALLKRHFAGELDSFDVELRMRHRNGHWVWVHDRGRVYEWTPDGRPLWMAGTHQEITARKEQERQLARLSRVAGETTNGVVITDRSGVAEWVNEGFTRLTGFTSAEAIGQRPGDLLQGPLTDAATIQEMRRAIREGGGFDVEVVNYTKAGVPYWVHISCTPLLDADEGLQGFIAIETDVDQRKRLEEDRRRSEALLRETGRTAGVGGWSLDFRTGALHWTEVTRQIHEVPDDFVPRLETAIDFYAEASRPIITAAVERGMRDGTPWDLELEIVTARGNRVWVRTAGRVEFQDGAPVRAFGSFQDITAQRTHAQALQEALDRSERYLDTVQTLVVAVDTEGRITMVNRRACEVLGWEAAELVGRDWFSTCVPTSRRRTAFAAVMAGERPLSEYFESQVVCRDGSLRVVAWHNALVTGSDGRLTGVLSSGEDITVKRELEQRVNRSQRLEAIGTMAGGIAHDLNNALSPIAMSLEILRESLPGEEELLSTLERSTEHATRIVRQLLAFARGAKGDRTPLDPVTLVREVEGIMHSLFPKSVKIEVECEADLPAVDGDTTQLHQVLLNLCVNARDAMPGGGSLTISVASQVLGGPLTDTVGASARPGRYVVFRVSDTGEGIPPALLERIFEPFFTTKSIDKGTGLGLSTVVGITRSHDGFVRVDSTPGLGSTFEVYLPASQSASTSDAEEGEPPIVDGQGASVLYVDDEDAVRHVAARVLERLGFRAIVADGAAEAQAILATRGGEIRVVITDLHMPDVDGLSLARAIRTAAPALPVIIASGRLDDETRVTLDAIGGCSMMHKPFNEAGLSAALSRAIG